MKDLIYYEDRFFQRLQELFSEHAQKQILITERAEIYYFIMYGKYKLFIRKSKKNYQVCGQNFEELNNFNLFEKMPIIQVKNFYNIYYKGTFYECKTYYDTILEKAIKNGLLFSFRTKNKR